MSLAQGAKVGPYEILSPLGAGGMGEVYRARDTKLNRDVAVKTLPDELVRAPERLARFKREAQVLASLNHPHIGAIYGLEETDGRPFLVLELVEGEDLAEILTRGPLPVDEALDVARQVAGALEAAHESGIVHRDLKPANVKRRPDGTIKVLDFGLAKAYGPETPGGELSQSPTMSRQATAAGVILGTASYMSPEQARGKTVDKRTDVWAFACLVFEMLTGHKAFDGETVTDVLAAIVKNEPDWTLLPETTPARVRDVLERCLEKEPKERLRDAGDARLLMTDAGRTTTAASSAPVRPFPWMTVGVVATAIAIIAGLLGWNLRFEEPQPVLRFTTAIPRSGAFDAIRSRIALSPDGTKLVHRSWEGGRSALLLRELDQNDARSIPDAESPFFSPDGEWLGFFERFELSKMRIDGGTPLPVALLSEDRERTVYANSYLTGSWGEDGTIVFTTIDGLSRVSAEGGPLEPLTRLDAARGEIGHYWPERLPGERALLYNVVVAPSGRKEIKAQRLGSSESHVVIEGISPRYVRTGHLLFVRNGTLFAARFDVGRLALEGEPFPVVRGVATDAYGEIEFAQYDVAKRTGLLAYLTDVTDRLESTLVWVDRSGNATPVTDERGSYIVPRISHDGRRVAFARFDGDTGQRDVWVLDVERGTRTRITLGEGLSTDPVWSPDDRLIAFGSTGSEGRFRLFTRAADGGGEARLLPVDDTSVLFPRSWTPDGAVLVYASARGAISLFHFEAEPRTTALIDSPFNVLEPRLSPDGRWLAYVSNESGAREVYVRPFPDGEGRWLVSNDGGDEPLWSPAGDELFYRSGDRVMVVSLDSDGGVLTPKAPSILFEGNYERDPYGSDAHNWDIAPDGTRFVMIRPDVEAGAVTQPLNIVVNWYEELESLDPGR